MTSKAWLIIGIELILSLLVIHVLLGQVIEETKRADTAEQNLKLATATITDMQTRQRDVAALDAKYTKELADAQAENAALQRKLDNGGRVLVKGKCPVPATTETSTTGMGHDAAVELSDVAGRNVLGIRSGIKQDQSALKVLQEYITTQCLK
ncbi:MULTISPECIES: lysis protein [Enterobacter cloacae complex]|jgi:prophage endopeptidase|uniref:lysis protein n=1 Tax=Enterobacter cloacae complex TaxID=354276 RepID=UPI00123B0F1D|nr:MULTISPECIES: lysis protein [Enterobacter cloacae complex]WGG66948.1 lysis protein [Enterobacter ludwigii]